MKGIIPKRIVSKSLDCHTCIFFRDDDEDIYYCELDKTEFPHRCTEYLSKCDALMAFIAHQEAA